MSHLQGEQNIPWQKLSRDCSPFDYTFRPRPSNESGTYAGYERQVQAILGNYCHQVAIYSRRRLTYDYDALNAFAGFMQHYSEETRPIPIMRTMSGLPIKIFTSDGRPGTASIFITLTWHHAPPDTMQLPAWKNTNRRNEFPSWTWAGWQQAVVWPCQGVTNDWKASSLRENIILVLKDGTLLPPHAEETPDRLDLVACIRFDAPVITDPRTHFFPKDGARNTTRPTIGEFYGEHRGEARMKMIRTSGHIYGWAIILVRREAW